MSLYMNQIYFETKNLQIKENICDYSEKLDVNESFKTGQIKCEAVLICINYIIHIINFNKCFNDHLSFFKNPDNNKKFFVLKGTNNVNLCFSCNEYINVNMFVNILFEFTKNCYPKLLANSTDLQKINIQNFNECPELKFFFEKNNTNFNDVKINVLNYYNNLIQKTLYNIETDSYDNNTSIKDIENSNSKKILEKNNNIEISLIYNPFLNTNETNNFHLLNNSEFETVKNDSKILRNQNIIYLFLVISVVLIFIFIIIKFIWLFKKKNNRRKLVFT